MNVRKRQSTNHKSQAPKTRSSTDVRRSTLNSRTRFRTDSRQEPDIDTATSRLQWRTSPQLTLLVNKSADVNNAVIRTAVTRNIQISPEILLFDYVYIYFLKTQVLPSLTLTSKMVVSISSLQAALQPVLTPIHPQYLPFPLVDLYGAMRLSSVVNWMATGAFDPPSPATNKSEKGKKGKALGVNKERATALQEVFGILVVVFGGETFLGTNSCN